jgi:hypothetical protein
MQIVPLKAAANYTFQTNLNNQAVQINIYTKSTGLFMDVLVNNAFVVAGVICQDRNRIVRSAYLGFSGDLAFVNQQGTDDPVYTGLGSRYLLYYFDVSDLAAMGYSG